MLTRKNGKMRQFSSYRDNYVSAKEDSTKHLDFLVFSLGNLVQEPNNGCCRNIHKAIVARWQISQDTNVARHKYKCCKIQMENLQETNRNVAGTSTRPMCSWQTFSAFSHSAFSSQVLSPLFWNFYFCQCCFDTKFIII